MISHDRIAFGNSLGNCIPLVASTEQDHVIHVAATVTATAVSEFREILTVYSEQASALLKLQMDVLVKNNQQLDQLIGGLFNKRISIKQANEQREFLVSANKAQWKEIQRACTRMRTIMQGQFCHAMAVADTAVITSQTAQQLKHDDAKFQMEITQERSKLIADQWARQQEEERKNKEVLAKIKMQEAKQALAEQEEANRNNEQMARQEVDHALHIARIEQEGKERLAIIQKSSRDVANLANVQNVLHLIKKRKRKRAKNAAKQLVKKMSAEQTAPQTKKHRRN